MADVTRSNVDDWVEMIGRLHDNVAIDPGYEREAARAAAVTKFAWSGEDSGP